MNHPSLSLQAAIVAALTADAPLVALLGGPKIHENVPANAVPPWVAFGDISARTVNAVALQGHVHRIALNCVSDQPGTRQCADIAQRVRDVLTTAPLTLVDHTLVNIDVVDTALRRTGKNPNRVMVVTLRAMTQQQP